MKRPNISFLSFIPIVFVLFLLIVSSCNHQSCTEGESLMDFYYPKDDLKSAKIYKFVSRLNPKLSPNYWWIQSIQKDDKEYLATINFDQRFMPLQIGIEEITEAGAFMDKLVFIEHDSIKGTVHHNHISILKDNLFPFCATKGGGVYLYSLEWATPKVNDYIYTLYRNRRYLRDTIINDKVAKIFSVNDEIDIYLEDQGYTQPQIRGFEIYAEGKGLVQYVKAFDSSEAISYELDTIFDADSFNSENGINFTEWEEILDTLFVQ